MSIHFGPSVLLPELHTCPICLAFVHGAAYEGPNCVRGSDGRVAHSMHRECAIDYVHARKVAAAPEELVKKVACPTCGKSLYVLDKAGGILRDEFEDPPGIEELRTQAQARKRAAEAAEGEATARRLSQRREGDD